MSRYTEMNLTDGPRCDGSFQEVDLSGTVAHCQRCTFVDTSPGNVRPDRDQRQVGTVAEHARR